jgi:EAL domain-containing protein (putative c-di-GMP-specific phosphodiesterase class I)
MKSRTKLASQIVSAKHSATPVPAAEGVPAPAALVGEVSQAVTKPVASGRASGKVANAPKAKPGRPVRHPKTRGEVTRSLKLVIGSNRERRVFGLLCVQLNASDAIEALGTEQREKLLEQAHRRLALCVRTTDVVAVGDRGTFLIVANDLNSEDELEIISDRIQANCRTFYTIDEREIAVGMTIGAAGTDGGSAATELIARAVTAMNTAASRRVPFELARTTPSAATLSPVLVESGDSSQVSFDLAFVPQFRSDGSVAGARVIVELPKARVRAGSAGSQTARLRRERIRDQVLRRVLDQLRSWKGKGLAIQVISIEIGASQFRGAGFADFLLSLLRETHLPGASLELLLTESTILAGQGEAAQTIADLEKSGVHFGLCGFSLNAGSQLDLRKLALTSLRVSCSSLFRVTSAAESLWVARSMVSVARRCGLQFVGEDVETNTQKEILLESGCERFEGPLFSPPLAAREFETLLVHE